MNKLKSHFFCLTLILTLIISLNSIALAFNVDTKINYNLTRGSTLGKAFKLLENKSNGKVAFYLDSEIDTTKEFRLSAEGRTFKEVLNLILQMNELKATRITENMYHVYPREKYDQYKKLEKAKTNAYQIDKENIETIEENLKKIYDRQIEITVDKQEEIIFIKSNPNNFEDIERIIDDITQGIEYVEKEYSLNTINIEEAAQKLNEQYDIKRTITGEGKLILTHRKKDTKSIKRAIKAMDIEYIEKKYQLSHADIDKAIEELKKEYGDQIERFIRGENSLIITHEKEIEDSIEEAIDTIDNRNFQAEIDVTILEFVHSEKDSSGVNWSTPDGKKIMEKLLDISAEGTPDFITYPAQVGITDFKTDTEIISNPQIRAENYEESRITIGESIPIIEGQQGEKGIEVTYKDVGIILETTPNIHNQKEITLDVNLSVDNLGQKESTPGGEYYRINTKSVKANIMLKDGHTVAFGGLMREEKRKKVEKIPILHKAPVLGNLFKWTKSEPEKVEIVMLITPHIINIDQEVDRSVKEEKEKLKLKFDNDKFPYDYKRFR